jgi:hypothetical protein
VFVWILWLGRISQSMDLYKKEEENREKCLWDGFLSTTQKRDREEGLLSVG